jgi:hypothetical protein
VGFYAAENDVSAGELVEGVVEIRGAAAAKGGLIDRVRAGQQLGYLGNGRAERFGALLAPEDWDVEDSGGFDKDLDVLEEDIFFVHQLGELALDVNDHQGGVFYIRHSVAPSFIFGWSGGYDGLWVSRCV